MCSSYIRAIKHSLSSIKHSNSLPLNFILYILQIRGMKDKVKGFIMAGIAKKIMGSGKHTGSNHDYYNGNYNGYNYRPGPYGSIQGATCSNNQAYSGMVISIYNCFLLIIKGFGFISVFHICNMATFF